MKTVVSAKPTRMKKLYGVDSFSTLMPISSTSTDENNQGNGPILIREFGTMLDEELNPVFEKKRRLTINQVKELERNFEVDKKLGPERKMKLALEVSLQPRQVAVWFQNRRARWKTKQLERDYVVLKSNYNSLKHDMEKLQLENQAFLTEIEELKSKLNEDGEIQTKTKIQERKKEATAEKMKLVTVPVQFSGGSYDSDSSGVMNNDDNNTAVSCFLPTPSCFKLADGDGDVEHSLFGEEEDSCSCLFSVDQAPTLHWHNSTDNDWDPFGNTPMTFERQ